MDKKRVGVPDFVLLSEISEDKFVENLVERGKKEEIYTYIGEVVVALNPYKSIDIFSDAYVNKYKNKYLYENEPHIYALGDDVVRSLMQTHNNQCIVISGESGAGKTESAKLILSYISAITPASKSTSVGKVKEKLLKSNPVLEAFGNAKTLRNDNSSRFGKYMEIQFDFGGAPVGGRITNYLLEKSRVVKRLTGERAFHIFYQVLAGVDEATLTQLHLQRDASSYRYLASSECVSVPTLDDAADFAEVVSAFKVFNMAGEEMSNIFRIVAAVLHLGNVDIVVDDAATAAKAGHTCTKIGNPDVCAHVASCLGVDAGVLAKALTLRTLVTTEGETVTNLDVGMGCYARDAMAKFMYSKLFRWLVEKLNQGVEAPAELSNMQIGILDIYGFEVFKENGFEQFCINYVNETLQQLFIELILKAEQEEYLREGIEWTEIEYFNNQVIVDMIETKGGMIALLDDTCALEGEATDANFLTKLDKSLGSHNHYVTYATKRDKAVVDGTFVIKHYAGDVTYNVEGFVDKNRDQLFRDIIRMLCSSNNTFVQQVFPSQLAADLSNKRPPTTGFQFREAVRALMASLKECQPHYVRCIKPNSDKAAGVFDDELIRHQVRYLGLLENVRVRRAGFANRQPYERFMHRYKMLGGKETWPTYAGDPRQAVEIILEKCGIEKTAAAAETTWRDVTRFGKTKLFIRNPETLFFYEEAREERMPWVVTQMQRVFRGFLGRIKARRHRAARLLQSYYRGHVGYISFTRVRAAVEIQKHFRGADARLLTAQSDAAKTIQRVARGWKHRHVWVERKNATVLQRAARRYLANKHHKERLERFFFIYVANLRREMATRIQLFTRRHMARKCLHRLIKVFAHAKDDNKETVRYGKKYDFPTFPVVFRGFKALFEQLRYRYWAHKMVTSLDADGTLRMKQKIRTSDIFKGKKPSWAVARRWSGDYLKSDPRLAAALARPPLAGGAGGTVFFSTRAVKVNRKGASQERILLFTDKGVWKLDGKSYKVKKTLTPLTAITALTFSPHEDSFVIIRCTPPYRDFVVAVAPEADGEKATELAVRVQDALPDDAARAALKIEIVESTVFNNARKPNQPDPARGEAKLAFQFVQDPKIAQPTFVKGKGAAPATVQIPKQ